MSVGAALGARDGFQRAPELALADSRDRLPGALTRRSLVVASVLLGAVLVKHFADRQLRVMPLVIGYLVPRMERSFAMAATLAARLDELALATGRPIGLPLTRRALAELVA